MPDDKKTGPLYENRRRSHAQRDLGRLAEMRQRGGRPVPPSWRDELKEGFETNHTGKVGKPTGRMKTVCPAPGARIQVSQTRTVGSGKADREAASKVNDSVFARLKNEASVADMESSLNRAEQSRKAFAKPKQKPVAAR